GHLEARALLADPDRALITGTWTRVEVSGALVRAAWAGRAGEHQLLALLDADLADDGPVVVVAAPQDDVERVALQLVRSHGIRAMDAWHLATAGLVLPGLLEKGEEAGFATRDGGQAEVALALGFTSV
ncbi:hypothetical protein B1A_20084, partial [mine drainage metagenome]